MKCPETTTGIASPSYTGAAMQPTVGHGIRISGILNYAKRFELKRCGTELAPLSMSHFTMWAAQGSRATCTSLLFVLALAILHSASATLILTISGVIRGSSARIRLLIRVEEIILEI